MPKKKPIHIKRDEDLLAIDDELDEAMERLSGVNREVDELLASFDEPPGEGEAGEAPPEASTSSEGQERPESTES